MLLLQCMNMMLVRTNGISCRNLSSVFTIEPVFRGADGRREVWEIKYDEKGTLKVRCTQKNQSTHKPNLFQVSGSIDMD